MSAARLQKTTHNIQKKIDRWQLSGWATLRLPLLLAIFWLGLSACSTDLQTRVSGNLDQLSQKQTIAILPVEFVDKSQREAANMFRQSLYANLKESKFNLLEPYLVDGLLKKNGLTQPEKFSQVNPMHLGEVLGVDTVLISRINKVQRAYLILHSSIELSVSLQMVDTRTGEILWRAEQTESDFQGLGKIPTGITAAIISPIYFVTNKLNMNRLTSKMVNKLTAILKHPLDASEEETFKEPVIATAASRDIDLLKNIEHVKAREARKDLKNSDKPKVSLKPRVSLASANLFPILPMTISAGYRSNTHKNPKRETKPITESKIHPSRPLTLATKLPILYTIQVGAYKTRILAEEMIHSLADKGYHAFLALLPTKDKTPLYRVRVDRFVDKNQARQLAKRLEEKENLESFIIAQSPG